eukprot:TRINITY_DN21754_c0_g1_i2.p1 TRINITY_DN21754_c0_g1~~TRINITY_DN21754_c0_g1_i2.p1  ORF type:complete len:994 (-),score=239.46 TRINITY_DN21754_c0_g1_i2:70-3051(-)
MISQWYFRRRYTLLEWIAIAMMTLAICDFVALRERYRECVDVSGDGVTAVGSPTPAQYHLKECGTHLALQWLREHRNWTGALCTLASVVVSAMASCLTERLFHAWKGDHFVVLKFHMDMTLVLISGCQWILLGSLVSVALPAPLPVEGFEKITKNELDALAHVSGLKGRDLFSFAHSSWIGEWSRMEILFVVIVVCQSWTAGLIVKYFNTVMKSVLNGISVITALLVIDRLFTTNGVDERGPAPLFLVSIAYMSAILFNTGMLYQRERRVALEAVPLAALGISMADKDREEAGLAAETASIYSEDEEEADEQDSAEEERNGHGTTTVVSRFRRCVCWTPWFGRWDDAEDDLFEKIETAEASMPEQRQKSTGSGMDMQCLTLSVVYIVTDTIRTLLNQYALSNSQINPNSMSLMAFVCGLAYASLMTYKQFGWNQVSPSGEETGKGLKSAWSLKKILEYSSASMLQALTMCLVNMSYALGLSAPMAAVLGKVYTPTLAIGERVILGRHRLWIEWIATGILTMAIFTFAYLSVYDVETGMKEIFDDSTPLVVCVLGAVAAAVQSLVSERIYDANRGTDFYSHKVRFDAGSAVFTLALVPLLSVFASRRKDIVWLPRPGDSACNVSSCWPEVDSELHWPWALGNMSTCAAPPAGPCDGACECVSGLFAAWSAEPSLYAFLFINIVFGILVGKIMMLYGSLHRAKCDGFSLVVMYWVGNPIMERMANGVPFEQSLEDICLNIVSLIVPLAAVASGVGKMATQRNAEEKTCFRLGLLAGLWSRLCGREVGVIISDPAQGGAARDEEDVEEGALREFDVKLVDQRAAQHNDSDAFVRVVSLPPQVYSKGQVREIFASNQWQLASVFKRLAESVRASSGCLEEFEEVPTRVVIGARAKRFTAHMVVQVQHGVMVSARVSSQDDALEKDSIHLRHMGFAATEEAKESLESAIGSLAYLEQRTQISEHGQRKRIVEQLLAELSASDPRATPPYIEYFLTQAS